MAWVKRLSGRSGKMVLSILLLLGLTVSMFSFWRGSTPEERQNLVETTKTMELVEQSTGALGDVAKEDEASLRESLKPVSAQEVPIDFEQQVWEQDIRQLIQRWVPDEQEAASIARWVYVYSVRFDLSPELLLGLMAVESRFDHFAVSNVGARGLMQVMPFWKKELGQPTDNLFEIETNVRYGSAILKYYLKRYKTERRALAAYNGSLGKDKYPNKVFLQMRRFKAVRKNS